MTEKEKMLAHQWYDANYDTQLHQDLLRAKDLCYDYNQTRPSDLKKRIQILSELLGYETENVVINSPLDMDYGWNVKLGKNIFVNSNCYFMDGGGITIGNNVFIGPSCGFYTAHHSLTHQERNIGLELALPITIGNNIWIGGNVVVTPGVTIGDGSVIAAGAVVTKDVPPNSLVAGIPAKVVRVIDDSDSPNI